MNQIQLSICIATLNRASFLRETLDVLLAQTSDEIEIVVVDGASTDNTSEVVKNAAARFDRLRYLRLEKKGGVDHDYCKAVELARGKYVWLFTDDDLLKPGTVKAVLEAAQKDYSLIIVNAEVRTKNLAVCLRPLLVDIQNDCVYSPEKPHRDRMLADFGGYLSFIGAVVIKREIWLQREKEKYFGTEFIHMGVIFQAPLPGDTLMMAYPWIVIRYGNAQWMSRSFKICMLNWPDLIWGFPDFADWAKKKIAPREPWLSYSKLLFLRAQGRFSIKEYDSILAGKINSFPRRILTQFIAAAPIKPLNFLARYYARWILRKVPSMGLYELEAWHKSTNSSLIQH
jgi:glycosyltransferase involved in cell wall biosynthesis